VLSNAAVITIQLGLVDVNTFKTLHSTNRCAPLSEIYSTYSIQYSYFPPDKKKIMCRCMM